MNHNEHMRSPENLLREDLHEVSHETRLSLARAEEICASRERTLASLEHEIGAALFEALHMKMRYERTSLFEHIEAAARAAEARRRSEPLLRTEFFTRKPLVIDIF